MIIRIYFIEFLSSNDLRSFSIRRKKLPTMIAVRENWAKDFFRKVIQKLRLLENVSLDEPTLLLVIVYIATKYGFVKLLKRRSCMFFNT